MLNAKHPDITQIYHSGKMYKIYDAFPNPKIAEETATGMRSNTPYPFSGGELYRCRVVTVDLGPDAGRLRYGIFIAKGAIINKVTTQSPKRKLRGRKPAKTRKSKRR